ncbi:MAG: molybdenum cofactor biosynthesis protein MoaE [Bryobacteraceae bacterium]
MQIKVLFFGMLRDIAGRNADTLELPEGAKVEAAFAHYTAQFPRLAEMRRSIVPARNQQFCDPATELTDGDELAFLPPVSGGADAPATGFRDPFTHVIEDPAGHFFALTREPIDARALIDGLQRPEDGAVVDFEGVVRNNTKGRETLRLEYECYEDMAIKMMAQIGLEIAASIPIGRIGMIHRLGRMEIGEASVVVVASSPHRKAAFEAALEGINRLKRTVPIWKKEFFADGEVWVEGEWDDKIQRAGS